MTDSDVEYLERVAEEAHGIGHETAPSPYAGEGRRLPHTFTGSHGTMGPLDVGDDESDVPPAQPDPPDLGMHVRLEPGRQESISDVADGKGVVATAEPPLAVGPIVGNSLAAGAASGVGVGLAADAAGMWATESGVADATAETPPTQVYADDVCDGAASEADSEHSSVGGSDAGSSTSTAASTGPPEVTFFPTLSEPPIPRCIKCGLEV